MPKPVFKKPATKPLTFLGLDISLTATGVVALRHPMETDGMWTESREFINSETISTKLTGPARHAAIKEHLKEVIAHVNPAMVAVEGYAHGAKFQAHAMGEIGGIVRLLLWETGIPFVEVAPKKLKGFMTGDANASKAKVIKAMRERWRFDTKDHNQADAYGLATLACLRAAPVTVRNEYQMSAAEYVIYPQMEVIS